MNGNDENQDKQKQQEQQEQQKRAKGLLVYSLLENYDNAYVAFTLEKQAPQVTDFLERIGVYTASNRMQIALGYKYQWKDSLNTIYLDSGLSNIPLNQQKPDITYFGKQLHFSVEPGSAKQAIRNKVTLFDEALAELIDVVKKLYPMDIKEPKSPQVSVRILT